MKDYKLKMCGIITEGMAQTEDELIPDLNENGRNTVRGSNLFSVKIKMFLMFLVMLICTSSLLAGTTIKTIQYSGKRYIYIKDMAAAYGLKASVGRDSAVVYGGKNKIVFVYDKKAGSINNVNVHYICPPAYNGGNPVVSERDFSLLIDPIVRDTPLISQDVRTVVIDPGHGGQDNGTSGRRSKEKNIALMIGRKLANTLIARGYKVVMTRNKDVFVPLESRASVASRYNGDLFISIHCNSSQNGVSGVETFALAPAGTSSTYSKTVSGYDYGNRYDKNNARLGFELQRNMNKLGRVDRGLKHSRFAVLRFNQRPAVLIETGFLSNPSEEQLLMNPDYQQKVAYQIAAGVDAYKKAVSNP